MSLKSARLMEAAQSRSRSLLWMTVLLVFVWSTVPATAASPGEVVVGVNLVNAPYDLTVSEQEAILGAMQKAGVRVIRVAVPLNDKGISFAERVYAHGIKILLLGGMHYSGAWPVVPKGFAGLWGLPGLSQADPERLRADAESLFAKLEARGIVLAGIEVSNEINWTGFNADFPLPGQGRILGASDLTNDPEGQQIAKGLLLYVKSLEVLKDVRDHSNLNQHTPIISAGLADLDNPNHKLTWVKADAASSDATLEFLRAHGLDKLVDGYGLHFYPNQKTAAERLAHIKENGLEQCQPPGSAKGKPCWVTEWGFNYPADTCPVSDIDDAARTALVREIRGLFSQLAQQDRVMGLFFYNWQGNIRAPKEDRASAFRCGTLTNSGKLALSPNWP